MRNNFINGVIFSPRDISHSNLITQLIGLERDFPTADRLFDPQYYSCLLSNTAQVRLGYLPEDYYDYFTRRRRLDLSRESQIEEDIRRVLQFQLELNISHLISPNILISRSFDSREASIAIDFLAIADRVYRELAVPRPLLLTLAVSREAFLDRANTLDFINELTGLGISSKGYYLLVAAENTEARSEIFHGEVIAGWMFLNYAFKINGFDIINGYSDLLMPFLGSAGAAAGATGWWSNLRTFSLGRFGSGPGGGRLPVQRYLSIALLSRITFSELDSLRTIIPQLLNNLSTDEFYDAESGSEPQRNKEVLQSWEALKHITMSIGEGNIIERLDRCLSMIDSADETYQIVQQYVQLDQKSNNEHLEALKQGIELFKQTAELNVTVQPS